MQAVTVSASELFKAVYVRTALVLAFASAPAMLTASPCFPIFAVIFWGAGIAWVLTHFQLEATRAKTRDSHARAALSARQTTAFVICGKLHAIEKAVRTELRIMSGQ